MKMSSDMYTLLIEIVLHLKRKTWNWTQKQQQANALTSYCELLGGYQDRNPGGVVRKLGGYNPPRGVENSLTGCSDIVLFPCP